MLQIVEIEISRSFFFLGSFVLKINLNTSETIISAGSRYFILQVHSTKYCGWVVRTPASFLDCVLGSDL
jgi:hypothetical protein